MTMRSGYAPPPDPEPSDGDVRDMPLGQQARHVALPERRAAEPEAMRRGRMRAGMNGNIIGWENLPASLLDRIKGGIMIQRDGDEWTRFRPALAGRTDAGEPYIVDSDCTDHWIGDGSAFPDPDAVLPEAVRREPEPGDLIRLHKTDDPAIADISRYEGRPADGKDGWMTDNGPYYACEWTLDGIVED